MRAGLVVVLGLVSAVAHGGPPEVASVRGYKGTDGQAVALVLLKPVKDRAALLRVRQSGSPFDGLVLAGSFDGTTFSTRFHGGEYQVLRVKEGVGRVYYPEATDFAVKFDEVATGTLAASELLAEHVRQEAAGELARFSHKEFPHLVKKYEAKAVQAVAQLARACGSAPPLTLNWTSFSDEDMENTDVWASCEPLMTQLRPRCGALKGLTQLVCRMGPALDLHRAADTLTFTTSAKGEAEGNAFLAARLGR